MTSDKEVQAIEEQVDEQAEQIDEEQVEEETDDQAEEQTQEQAELQAKIEKLDAKLAAHEAQHIDALKREQMKERYYSDEQIERYIGHIQGDNKEEIIESISKLEIPPANDNFADPSPFNGVKAKPKTVDHTEIGRQAFGRVKHKIFPWMR